MYSTNSRFLYSGSSNGKICIYDILTEKKVMEFKLGGDSVVNNHFFSYMSSDVLRDVSWHPYKPYLYATHFNGSVYITKFASCIEKEESKNLN